MNFMLLPYLFNIAQIFKVSVKYLAEDLKALHNAGYVFRYFMYPFSILVFDDSFCAIESFSECCEALPLLYIEEIIGWQHYMPPEYLLQKPYTKAGDIPIFYIPIYIKNSI